MKETTIKDFYGRVIGYIREEGNGNKTAFDFTRRLLGRFDKSTNMTKDFAGRVIARGDVTQALVYNSNSK